MSSPEEDQLKIKEAQSTIGVSLKAAQYTLTTQKVRGVPSALQETVRTLNALSTYLSHNGSGIKGAAVATQISKVVQSASAYMKGASISQGATPPASPGSSSMMLDDFNANSNRAGPPLARSDREGSESDLMSKLNALEKERDALQETVRELEMSKHDTSGNEDLREELRTVKVRVSELEDTLEESEAKNAALMEQFKQLKQEYNEVKGESESRSSY
ncbi:hypothetical protein AGDE_15721 [Angomonas deanei]|uniref:Uncharacterized protein n=1 Tax=Angomonas deanei TaxID=59799 RepID=A0A7G2CDI7_9TRYP|nr:hypothetical protein AGDE_15721 [Angomonas deanei]CAD2216192.1 hypothetical protein, conserved [Angomonas deanei]|eukprot:EPY18602.1 hypothetical protein AGDE_15721 [Angomonas deanei]